MMDLEGTTQILALPVLRTSMLADADRQLHLSKDRGRNRVTLPGSEATL